MTSVQPRRVAYLGPPGTYTEEAARRYAPQAVRLPFPNPAAVIQAVTSHEVDEGVVAIENSLEGSVTDVLDLLIHDSKLLIRAEVIVPIEHCLLVKPGVRAAEIETIYSHPQALGQCRRYIEGHFPQAQVMAALSTAAAVEETMGRDRSGAIGNQRSGELYGAEVLDRGVQDNSNNATRFVVLGGSDHPPTGRDKTSISFVLEDRPGSLVHVLQAFSDRSINLSKIESRPSKDGLGRYFFLVDLEGHRNDPAVQDALAVALEHADPARFKVFGSYPRASD